MTRCAPALIMLLLGCATAAAAAQPPRPAAAATAFAAAAARRFPQPVRVGDLLHRAVLQPVESQNVLGTVSQVVRTADGNIDIVMEYGGFLGFGARPIAVPVDAMVLVGQVMEVLGFTPQQLASLPTFTDTGVTALAPDTTIRVGLARPSH